MVCHSTIDFPLGTPGRYEGITWNLLFLINFQSCYNKCMDKKPEASIRNPETSAKHQTQFYVQILLPVGIGTLVLFGLGVFAASAGTDRPAVWANISTIFISIWAGLSGFLILGIISLLIFGVAWLTKKIPPNSYLVQFYAMLASQKLSSLSDQTAKPFVEIKSSWAGIASLFKREHKVNKEG
jgi:hypothetical protein